MEWIDREIEKPKDTRLVLIWNSGFHEPPKLGRYMQGKYNPYWIDAEGDIEYPTHWIPIPETPKP